MDPLSEGSVELRNTLGEDQQSESDVPNAWHDDYGNEGYEILP